MARIWSVASYIYVKPASGALATDSGCSGAIRSDSTLESRVRQSGETSDPEHWAHGGSGKDMTDAIGEKSGEE